MALISASVARCRRGRRDDFLAIALEGMKLFERHGARHARLLAATTAGEQFNSYVLTNEFDNAAGYGAFVDELDRDAEIYSFLAGIGAEDSPLVIESRSLATEIPLDRAGPRTHGRRDPDVSVPAGPGPARRVPRSRRSGVRLSRASRCHQLPVVAAQRRRHPERGDAGDLGVREHAGLGHGDRLVLDRPSRPAHHGGLYGAGQPM